MVKKYNFNSLIYGALSEKIIKDTSTVRSEKESKSPPDRIINNILNYSKSVFIYDLNNNKPAFIMN